LPQTLFQMARAVSNRSKRSGAISPLKTSTLRYDCDRIVNMSHGKWKLALVRSKLMCALFVAASCSSSAPTASPTALRLIAANYLYQVDPSPTCALASLPGIGGGPVQLRQDGKTAAIDAHLVAAPTVRNFRLSGVISGATLSFHLFNDFTLGVSAATAEGDGTATINGQSITGRFSGTMVYDPTGGAVPSQSRTCTATDHLFVLNRVQ